MRTLDELHEMSQEHLRRYIEALEAEIVKAREVRDSIDITTSSVESVLTTGETLTAPESRLKGRVTQEMLDAAREMV